MGGLRSKCSFVLRRSQGLLVHAELRIGRGITVGDNAVAMLMRRAGVRGLPERKRWRARPDTPSVADLVDRNFAVIEPDALWVTDVTEHPTREGKLYCSVVLDAYSRRVVGWSIDASQTAALVTNALGMAIENRSPRTGTILPDNGTRFHLIGLHDQGQAIGAARLDRLGRRRPRQRRRRGVLASATPSTPNGNPMQSSVERLADVLGVLAGGGRQSSSGYWR